MNCYKSIVNRSGYRLGIGIVLLNGERRLFWGKRIGKRDAWQFPQGGIHPYEIVEKAMYRELHEEIGLTSVDVQILGITDWLYYQVPNSYSKRALKKQKDDIVIGQKQKWFLLKLISSDNKINLNQQQPEFDNWIWTEYWEPVQKIIFFKKKLYFSVLKKFDILLNAQ